jgi:hypothetical protein
MGTHVVPNRYLEAKKKTQTIAAPTLGTRRPRKRVHPACSQTLTVLLKGQREHPNKAGSALSFMMAASAALYSSGTARKSGVPPLQKANQQRRHQHQFLHC